ncbi:MAG: ABC transporter substrate-binding protein [Elusimicrobiaceae bacterium]|nr:ABC transporter substrate-binding protein [Elusimicrobiaceae bacterium]
MGTASISAKLSKTVKITLAGAGLLALCAGAFAAAKNPGMLVYAHQGEPASLDPVYPYDGVSQGIIFNVYETLIAFKGPSLTEYVPVLAEKIPSAQNGLISKDGRTYRFPIKKGIRFSDGSPLTPDDVRYSLLRFMLTDPAGGPAVLLLEPILGISSTRDDKGKPAVNFEDAAAAVTVDGQDVVIRLKTPFAPFLSIMARWSYVMNRKWCAAQGEWDGSPGNWEEFANKDREKSGLFDKMNGTGPYRLARWDRQSRKVFLDANPAYSGKPPAIKRIVLATVPEFGTRRLMLEAGDADIIDVPTTFADQLAGMKNVVVENNLPRLKTDPVFFFVFKVNGEGNPDIGSGKLDGQGIPPDFFSEPDVRRAFAWSFDYSGYLKQGLKNRAEPAIGCIPPGLAGYTPDIRHYSFDPQKAETYFRKAYGGKLWNTGFKFTLTYNLGGEVRQLAAEILKRNVEKLNPKFRIELRGLEWAAYLDKAQNKMMPLFTRGWTGDYPDAHNFVFPFLHSRGRYASIQGYSNPQLDTLIEKAVREQSAAKRRALYRQIQNTGFGDAPQIYTVHPVGLYARRAWLRHFTDNAVYMGVWFHPLSKKE